MPGTNSGNIAIERTQFAIRLFENLRYSAIGKQIANKIAIEVRVMLNVKRRLLRAIELWKKPLYRANEMPPAPASPAVIVRMNDCNLSLE